MYMSARDGLKEHVLKFQSMEPTIHILHDKQVELLQNYLGFFVNHMHVPQTGEN